MDQKPNKYVRLIRDIAKGATGHVDVYCVLEAFDVRCPARQHAIKKLLCAGLRGKGDAVQDLVEAGEAVARAVVLERQRAVAEPQVPAASDAYYTVEAAQTICRVCHNKLNYPVGGKMRTICHTCAAEAEEARKLAAEAEAAAKETRSIMCVQCGETMKPHTGRDKKWPNRCDRCVEMLTNMAAPPPTKSNVVYTECRGCGTRMAHAPGTKISTICPECFNG